MNPGELKDSIGILTLVSQGKGYLWSLQSNARAKAEWQKGKNIFSNIGMGVKTVKFTIRKQVLSLHNAFEWQNKHCFLTEITEKDRLNYEVTAAIVSIRTCIIKRESEPTYDSRNRPEYSGADLITFPGVLTEKYIGNIQNEPMTTMATSYILVTPKLILLKVGEIVAIDETPFEILSAHTLDEYKNQFEIISKGDA